jgi:hypothetical protein
MKTIRIYDLAIDPSDPTIEDDIFITEDEYDFDDIDFDDEESIEDFVVEFLHNEFDVDVIGYLYEVIEQ